jgi:uncharacterized protein (UPF0248 family)
MDYRSTRMIPIQELLNRIRWDDAYAEGDFLIGYYDRISGEIIQVPLQQVEFTPGNHFFFRYTDPTVQCVRSPSTASGKSTGTVN